MTELFIQEQNKKMQIALVENGKLIEYYEEDGRQARKEGNIYVGIVKDIVRGMQSAFVDIGTEKNSFIHLKDIVPKVDEKKEKVEKEIMEGTGAKAGISWGDSVCYALIGKKIEIF